LPAAAIEPGPPPGGATAQELQELVSPIALNPDVLVAQILAGSTLSDAGGRSRDRLAEG